MIDGKNHIHRKSQQTIQSSYIPISTNKERHAFYRYINFEIKKLEIGNVININFNPKGILSIDTRAKVSITKRPREYVWIVKKLLK